MQSKDMLPFINEMSHWDNPPDNQQAMELVAKVYGTAWQRATTLAQDQLADCDSTVRRLKGRIAHGTAPDVKTVLNVDEFVFRDLLVPLTGGEHYFTPAT